MGAISEMSDMSKPSPFQVVETAAIQLTINQNKAPSTHMFLIWVYLSAHVIFFKLDQIRKEIETRLLVQNQYIGNIKFFGSYPTPFSL